MTGAPKRGNGPDTQPKIPVLVNRPDIERPSPTSAATGNGEGLTGFVTSCGDGRLGPMRGPTTASYAAVGTVRDRTKPPASLGQERERPRLVHISLTERENDVLDAPIGGSELRIRLMYKSDRSPDEPPCPSALSGEEGDLAGEPCRTMRKSSDSDPPALRGSVASRGFGTAIAGSHDSHPHCFCFTRITQD